MNKCIVARRLYAKQAFRFTLVNSRLVTVFETVMKVGVCSLRAA